MDDAQGNPDSPSLADSQARSLIPNTRFSRRAFAKTSLGAGFDAMGRRCGEELGESLRELAQAQMPPEGGIVLERERRALRCPCRIR